RPYPTPRATARVPTLLHTAPALTKIRCVGSIAVSKIDVLWDVILKERMGTYMDSQENQTGKAFPYHRRSLRLPKHDYTWTRGYFVTIRAEVHEPLFEIPELRAILMEQWAALPERFPSITQDEFVIMPDHMHFIIWLNGLAKNAPTLGSIIGAYKSLVTVAWIRYHKAHKRDYPGNFWLRGYFEIIISGSDELERIRYYIRTNPEKLINK